MGLIGEAKPWRTRSAWFHTSRAAFCLELICLAEAKLVGDVVPRFTGCVGDT